MSLPWSDKSSKLVPVDDDELLIIDSEDSNQNTTNKRVKIGNLPNFGDLNTPWETDIDAANFSLLNLGNIIFEQATATTPVASLVSIYFRTDATPDTLFFNVPDTNNISLNFNGTPEYNFSQTELDFMGNKITNMSILTSTASEPADNGVIRLGNLEAIEWRDTTNMFNAGIVFNSSNRLDIFISGTNYFFGSNGLDLFQKDLLNFKILTSQDFNSGAANALDAIQLDMTRRISWDEETGTKSNGISGDTAQLQFNIDTVVPIKIEESGIIIENTKSIRFPGGTGGNIGSTNLEKLAFWGVTPTIQPTSTGEILGFTGGVGAPVDDQGTFTGSVGSTAYTISDIVKHLKTVGLIVQ